MLANVDKWVTEQMNMSHQEQQRQWFLMGRTMTEAQIAKLPTSEQRFFARQGAAAVKA